MFQDSGKRLSEGEPHTSSLSKLPGKNFTNKSHWRTPTISQGAQLASKNSKKKSVLSKTVSKRNQEAKGKRGHCGQFAFLPRRLGSTCLSQTLYGPIRSLLTKVNIISAYQVTITEGLNHSPLTGNSCLMPVWFE